MVHLSHGVYTALLGVFIMKRIALAAAVLVFAACAPKDAATTAGDSTTAEATAQAPEAAPAATDSTMADSAAAPQDTTQHEDQ